MRSQVVAFFTSLLLACAAKPPSPPQHDGPDTPVDYGPGRPLATGPATAPVDVTYPDVPAGSQVDPPFVLEGFEPNERRAMLTPIALFKKTPCSTVITFCIDSTGATGDITTAVSCRDEALDALCRDTVAQWRYEPARLQGQPTRACTKAVFNFKFV